MIILYIVSLHHANYFILYRNKAKIKSTVDDPVDRPLTFIEYIKLMKFLMLS